jgi:hypothetical protein
LKRNENGDNIQLALVEVVGCYAVQAVSQNIAFAKGKMPSFG